jgi:hypothetical protein
MTTLKQVDALEAVVTDILKRMEIVELAAEVVMAAERSKEGSR